MKQTITFLLLAVLYIYSAEAQQIISTPIKKLHKSELWTSEQDYLTGAIFELKDSSILFSNSLIKDDYYKGDYIVSRIIIEDIKFIKYKKAGTTGRGMVWGGLIGVSAGVAIGLIDGDDGMFTAGEKAVVTGVSMGVFGGIIGGLIGGVKMVIPINGSMDVYSRNKKRLNRQTIKYSAK